LLNGGYDVQISSKGISNFKHKTVQLQYFISTEKTIKKFIKNGLQCLYLLTQMKTHL
jgi:hypothetical protein